jgi:hypothetical protein
VRFRCPYREPFVFNCRRDALTSNGICWVGPSGAGLCQPIGFPGPKRKTEI